MLSIHVFSLRGRFSSRFAQFYMPSSVPQLVSYFDYFTLLCQVRSHSPTKRPSFSRPTEVTTEISLKKISDCYKNIIEISLRSTLRIVRIECCLSQRLLLGQLILEFLLSCKKKYYSLKPSQPGGVCIFYRISCFRLNL